MEIIADGSRRPSWAGRGATWISGAGVARPDPVGHREGHPGYGGVEGMSARADRSSRDPRAGGAPAGVPDAQRGRRFHVVPMPADSRGRPGRPAVAAAHDDPLGGAVQHGGVRRPGRARRQERRRSVLMNVRDMERMGLRIDDRVIVRSEAGEMRSILVREGEIRAGNCAMYYPEADAESVPATVDKEWRRKPRRSGRPSRSGSCRRRG